MIRRPLVFLLGMLVFALSVLPPVDDDAAKFFSAHMIQHVVMLLVAAPLLASGIVINLRFRVLHSILAVGLVHAVALWAWHMPALYDAAMNSDPLHVLEHASFLITGFFFWSVVFDSQVDRFKRVALVFATMLQSSALGALIAFASGPLYQWHLEHTPAGHDALAQQQAAGAIMWIPPGGIYLVVMLGLIWRALSTLDPARQP